MRSSTVHLRAECRHGDETLDVNCRPRSPYSEKEFSFSSGAVSLQRLNELSFLKWRTQVEKVRTLCSLLSKTLRPNWPRIHNCLSLARRRSLMPNRKMLGGSGRGRRTTHVVARQLSNAKPTCRRACSMITADSGADRRRLAMPPVHCEPNEGVTSYRMAKSSWWKC